MNKQTRIFSLALVWMALPCLGLACGSAIVMAPASPPTSDAPPIAPANAIPIDPSQPMPASSYNTDVTLTSGVAATVTIDGRSDVFSAGETQADAPRGGVLPLSITLAPGGGTLRFSNVRGLAGCGPGNTSSPDGGGCAGGNTNIASAGVVSGIVDHSHSQFLVGVFLGDTPQAVPPSLDFSEGAIGEAFAELSPAIGQSFYIGDGLTGTASGEQQVFHIPATAIRLYLGYADANAFQGQPGWYSDNTGGIEATVVQQ